MRSFSVGQKKSLSDFLNTIAAAWFTAGVVAPLFTVNISTELISPYFILGLSMAISFLMISFIIMKEVNT